MVREVSKREASGYLKQADEFLASAQENLVKGRFNAAGFNAIQAIVNANDALTIYFLERRASKDHREAVKLHVDVVKIINDSSCRSIIKNALDARSAVGYLGKPTSKKEAEKLVRPAIKFIEWVRRHIE
jgi:HEPN domain-containing protein